MGRRGAALAVTLAVIGAGCYLPRADVDRPVETQVLVAVYRCTPDLVAGEVTNDAEVAISVVLKPKWLDQQRAAFHEVEIEPLEVPAGSTLEWEGNAGEEIDTPVFCEAETVSISAVE